MNVFVSETCYRQVFGGKRGRNARRIDDFNRLVARLQTATSRRDLQVKGLGTKKYRSLDHDVYGVDLNNGLTAERVIFLFVEPQDVQAELRFGRYRQQGQAETVLLCYCSEHDSQHRHAQLVGEAHAQGAVPQIAQVLPDAQLAELESVERLEVPWRTYAPGDLERYGKPRTPVLTEDKFRIVSDFLTLGAPMLVTGAAGSGKTELGLRIIGDFVRARLSDGDVPVPAGTPSAGAGPRVLYLTFSQRLLSEVETRCPDDVRPCCSFLTFDTLLRALTDTPSLRFAGAGTFASFVAALRARPAMGGPERARMLRLLDERGVDCAYAEVYGVIGGSMGAGWGRPGPAEGGAGEAGGLVADDDQPDLLPERDYLAVPDDRSNLGDERDRAAAHALARAYRRWVASTGLASRNEVALRCTRALAGEARRFDLVVADEVQDLTEVQIELLHRLCDDGPAAGGEAPGAPGGDAAPRATAGAPGRLFMTGDVNQVLVPTAFDARRLLRMDGRLLTRRLEGNFRNPEVICELANAVGEVRVSSRRLQARREAERAPERSFNRSVGRAMWWVGGDEAALARMADEAANIALITNDATCRRLAPTCSSVFTVEQVKGMEFDNVILYDMLAGSERRFDELFAAGPKDASLHRVVNELYVGVTRSCGSLLVAEPRGTRMLERLAELDGHFERVASLDEVCFDLDATAQAYLEMGRALREQGAFSAACANLERALRASGVPSGPEVGVAAPSRRDAARDEVPAAGALVGAQVDEARRLLGACRIYAAHDPQDTPEGELATLLERAGLYEEALPHARAALDARRVALLSLAADRRIDGARYGAADRIAAFEDALARGGLDVADLYGESALYDGLLDWYLTDRCDDMELLALETAGHVDGALANFRHVAQTLASMSYHHHCEADDDQTATGGD